MQNCLEENSLEAIIYWHSSSDEETNEKNSKLQDLELSAIHKCTNMDPAILSDFLSNYRFTLFEKLTTQISQETFYNIKIKFIGYYSECFEILAIEKVESTAKFCFEH
jgi:hypothetical protein